MWLTVAQVVLTDYPDDALTANLEYNVDENVRNEDIRKWVAVEVGSI